MERFWLTSILILLAITGCKVSVDSNGQRFNGAGVTFVAPLQTAEVNHGTAGIDYKSDKFTASTDGKRLVVNGKPHGTLAPGDVVDFTELGVVKVNGTLRSADGT